MTDGDFVNGQLADGMVRLAVGIKISSVCCILLSLWWFVQ